MKGKKAGIGTGTIVLIGLGLWLWAKRPQAAIEESAGPLLEIHVPEPRGVPLIGTEIWQPASSYPRPAYVPGGAAAPGQEEPERMSTQYYDPAELDLLNNTHSPKWFKEHGYTELAQDMYRERSNLVWEIKGTSGAEREALEETLHTMRIRDVEMELAEYKEEAAKKYSNPEGSWVYRAYVGNKEKYLAHLWEEWGMGDEQQIEQERTQYDEEYDRAKSETKEGEVVAWSEKEGFHAADEEEQQRIFEEEMFGY